MTRIERMNRQNVLHKRMMAEGHKAEAIVIAYGGKPQSDDGKLLVAGWRADWERDDIRYTTKGDFCHLAGKPLIIK